eukprot:COSAG02_NODE_37895_length_436_cov_0.721068_1_plen_38_part_10
MTFWTCATVTWLHRDGYIDDILLLNIISGTTLREKTAG